MGSSSNRYAPRLPNKKQNHLQNSLLREPSQNRLRSKGPPSTSIVASMLLILRDLTVYLLEVRLRLDCEYIHALCLSNFARPTLPSWVEVVGLLHTWIRSPSRPLNEDHLYTSLFVSPYKLGAPDCILGPDLVQFWSLFGFHFLGPIFGAPDFVWNCKGPKWFQMEPKQRPKYMTKMRTQNPQICTETQTRSAWSSFSGLLGDRIQVCNKLATSTKEGRETGRAKLLKQRAWIHSHTKRSQDMFYFQKIHSQVSREINSMLATMEVRPCVTAKLAVLRPWFWNLILLNLAAASCYFTASLVGGRCNASRLLRMCWSSRGLPRRFLAPPMLR